MGGICVRRLNNLCRDWLFCVGCDVVLKLKPAFLDR